MRRLSSPILRWAWIPYAVLLITLLLSVLTMYLAGRETARNDMLRFTNLVERTQGTISNQMDNYLTLLEGASGLHAASEEVTRSEFKTYVDRLSLRKRYPGIQGIGFVSLVPASEKDNTVAEVRAEGLSDFHIWPDEGQAIYRPIIYLEPLDARNRAALGYDMYTDPVRKAAMDHAVKLGGPAMSGKVTLVQEIDPNKQAGFLIYLPVYEQGIVPATLAERQANLEGYIYSPFRADDLFRSMLKGEKSPQLDFQVFDGAENEANLLHDSRNFATVRDPMYHPRYSQVQKITVAGRIWTIRYFSNQAFDAASDIWLIPFVLIFGFIVSGVLFILTRAQYEAGRKAEISEGNLQFIAEAGKILASSLDYKRTVTAITRLSVPRIGDWCSVDLRNGSQIETLAIAHKDERKIKLARAYLRNNPPKLQNKTGIGKVIRTGISEYIPVITEDMVRQSAQSEEEFKLLQTIGFASLIIVPLKVHRRVMGAMTLVSSSPKRRYTEADVAMAEEIAQRAAMAIEHAWLFAETQRAVEMRDEFISVASHELKTPVTSLKMYLQVLYRQLTRKHENTLAEAVGKMDHQIDKLTLLISDLLNVSRIQHGRLEYHDELFDLKAAVQEIIEQVQQTTKEHKISLSGSVKRKVFGDRDRIGQVLTNLLTNAIKYSPEADKIDVILSGDANHAIIHVRDYGIGIDKKHADKIFSRFYRVTDTNEKTFPGLGIGLFISQEIIRRHGGSITVESSKGEGSTFTFTLPYKKKE